MERKSYRLDRGPGEVNIIYVEGLNPDGTANDDAANKWNDLRLVLRFEGGDPKIAGSRVATTEPGRYYVDNPIKPPALRGSSSANIAPGRSAFTAATMKRWFKPAEPSRFVVT